MSEIDTYLRREEVLRAAGISKSTLYKWIGEGRFPRPRKVSAYAVRWSAKEVAEWQGTHG